MKLNAPRNQPQISYCNPDQQVCKPKPKERLQMPTPSAPIAPTHEGPTYDQLFNEVSTLRAVIVDLHHRLEANCQTMTDQDATISAMDRSMNGLKANTRPLPRTTVQFHGSQGPQLVQQQLTPEVSPDTPLALFNEEYDFSAGGYDTNTLAAPAAPPMTGNGQPYPYAQPSAASFEVGCHYNNLSGPSNLTANGDTFGDYSVAMPPQPYALPAADAPQDHLPAMPPPPYTLPTANAPAATPSKPGLLPVTNGKLVADASARPLPPKVANKPAEPVAATMAAALAPQHERQAPPAAEPLETQMIDGFINYFASEDMFE